LLGFLSGSARRRLPRLSVIEADFLEAASASASVGVGMPVVGVRWHTTERRGSSSSDSERSWKWSVSSWICAAREEEGEESRVSTHARAAEVGDEREGGGTHKLALGPLHDGEVQARLVALDELDELRLDPARPRRVGGVEADELGLVLDLARLDLALLDAERVGKLRVALGRRTGVGALDEAAGVALGLVVARAAARVLRQVAALAVDLDELGAGRIGGTGRGEVARCDRERGGRGQCALERLDDGDERREGDARRGHGWPQCLRGLRHVSPAEWHVLRQRCQPQRRSLHESESQLLHADEKGRRCTTGKRKEG